jgi:hypothetical protein
MAALTKEQCEQFLKNQTVNPITGREIEIGKATHKQLLKKCQKSSKSTSPKSTSPKSKDYEIPPIGPIIHWKNKSDELKNITMLVNYIDDRLKIIENRNQKESHMEFEEFENILKEAISLFGTRKKYIDVINENIEDVKRIKKEKDLVNDIPKKIRIELNNVVYPDRVSNRLNVSNIQINIKNMISYINRSIKNIEDNKDIITVSFGEIKDLLKDKKYLDYLIKHNIFTYDDIYVKTIEGGEKVFEELQEKYKKYRELYKEVNGHSPINKAPSPSP